ncbi:hypothetical protein HID58_017211 [Brassica napus]|uniref:Uncharacterized protein n=1 Tax=Brassica napus TaxID=3708 RepID=A0ABQ8D8Z5_BRANA|nr:hypothetical protein HID58_017211 [Brassica napus]
MNDSHLLSPSTCNAVKTILPQSIRFFYNHSSLSPPSVFPSAIFSMATIKHHEDERLRAVDLTSKPFEVNNAVSLEPKTEPEYIDINEAVTVSVSSGLAPISGLSPISSGLAPVSTVSQQTLPQGMIPMWAIPSNAVIPTVGAFFLVPHVSGPTNQPQMLAFPAAPPSSYVAAVQQASLMARPPFVSVSTPSVMAPSSSSGVTNRGSSSSTTNMLRDFSLEIYEKQELHQFMSTTTARSSSNH